ncbi:hypothetical protein RRG08_041127 [Elysia crispata]|uniref:Uncharacterized protein n=1 Tax=Elysia crispata TaxID=231223 RepID=A0AAE0XXQ2_9GAST|nr:hypothetical protein RRG08_041127 [Elysia crispata]
MASTHVTGARVSLSPVLAEVCSGLILTGNAAALRAGGSFPARVEGPGLSLSSGYGHLWEIAGVMTVVSAFLWCPGQGALREEKRDTRREVNENT